MENSKKYNLIIIALIAIVGLLFYQNVKFKGEMVTLQSRISAMESNINNELNYLRSGISNELERLINENQSIVSDYKFTYNGVDTKTGTVKALVEFSLKQSDAASRVYLNASAQSNAIESDYECMSVNGIDYTCEIDVSYSENYMLNMYQRSADGSQMKLNSNPYHQNIKHEFENRLRLMNSGTSTSDQMTDYSFRFENRTFGQEDFRVKKVVVKAFYMDEEVFAKDVTDYNIVNSEARDRLIVMMAAGEIDAENVPEEEYGDISIDEEGNEYGEYLVSILHSQTGAPVEYNNYPTYSFKVIVTLNNGEVYEL
jgi:Tfp pilus assembly major pilin PilA